MQNLRRNKAEDLRDMKLLNAWLKKPGNSISKLTYILGYNSTSTILAWKKVGYLPECRRRAILSVLREKN